MRDRAAQWGVARPGGDLNVVQLEPGQAYGWIQIFGCDLIGRYGIESVHGTKDHLARGRGGGCPFRK